MAKKVFYVKRVRLAKWQEPYITWFVLFLFLSPLLFFAGTKKYTPKNYTAVPETKVLFSEKNRFSEVLNKLPEKINRENEKGVLIQQFQKLKIKSYKGAKLSLDNCHHFFFLPEKKIQVHDFWLFVPYTEKKALFHLPEIFSFLEMSFNSTQIYLVLYDNFPHCSVDKLASQLTAKKLWKPFGALFYPQNSLAFNPVIYNHFALSITVQEFIKEIPYSPIITQIALGSMGNLTHAYPNLKYFDRFFIRLPVESLKTENILWRITHVEKTEFERNSFWISQNRQFYPWATVVLLILLLFLALIPIVNRITIKKAPFSLGKAPITALYYSLVMWLFFIFIYFLPLKENSYIFLLVSTVIFIALFYGFLSIKQRFLNLATDSTSALLFFYLLLILQAFIRPNWIFLLSPSLLLLGFIKEKPLLFSFILVPLALLLPVSAIWLVFREIPFLYWSWDSWELLNISLLGGAFLSLTDRQIPL